MAVPVTMPRLGESVSEGTITRWLKKEGERVEVDEPLLEVSTDKVDTEIPAPAAGVLTGIKVAEDETVEVGAELATIDDTGDGAGGAGGQRVEAEPAAAEPAEAEAGPAEAGPAEAGPDEAGPAEAGPDEAGPAEEPGPETQQPPARQEARGPEETHAPEARADETSPQPGDGEGAEGSYVTPLVRKLAAEHGVDLAGVHGSGVGGRIRKQDVLDAARGADGAARQAGDRGRQQRDAPQPSRPAPQTQPPAGRPAQQSQQPPTRRPAPVARGTTEKLSRLRQVIAARMTESLQTSAQLTTVAEVDVSRIARLRERAKDEFERREGIKLNFLPFFAVATCEALKDHPKVNASIDTDAGTVTYHDGVHLGIAVDTERGLLVPVVHDAGDLNLAGLARKIADLAERTRENRVGPDELGGGTFTLTNTGSRGVLIDTPIINQPQVAILGTGAVVRRPVVVDDPEYGEIVAVRHMVYLSLTYDHRLVDGADAARFVGSVKGRLEAGEFEGDLGL